MKFSSGVHVVAACLLSAAASASVLERANKCNADNCLRAVRASNANPGPSSARKDCSNYLYTLLTPCPTTTTLTFVQVSGGSAPNPTPVTTTAPAAAATTTATPTCPQTYTYDFQPTYASSACGGADRYHSACNCIGVTGFTITYPPLATVVTTTTTVAPSNTACAKEFILVPKNAKYAGYYLGTDGIAIETLTDDIAYATKFFLDENAGTANVSFSRSSGQTDPKVAFVSKNDPVSYVFQYGPEQEGVFPLACSIAPDGSLPNSGSFTCHQRLNSSISTLQTENFQQPINNVIIADGIAYAGYEELNFRAVPVC